MGRKLVDSGSVVDGPDTTRKIDALKEMFNVLGAQVQLTQQLRIKASRTIFDLQIGFVPL